MSGIDPGFFSLITYHRSYKFLGVLNGLLHISESGASSATTWSLRHLSLFSQNPASYVVEKKIVETFSTEKISIGKRKIFFETKKFSNKKSIKKSMKIENFEISKKSSKIEILEFLIFH